MKKNKEEIYLFLIILSVGFIWLKSSFAKLITGTFLDNFPATINKFISKNPYLFYKDFLKEFVIPNQQLFGNLVLWGELLTGLSIVFSVVYLIFKQKNKLVLSFLMIGLIGGLFLNKTFWLASGWTSPSADSINLLMFLIELVSIVFVFNLLKSAKPTK